MFLFKKGNFDSFTIAVQMSHKNNFCPLNPSSFPFLKLSFFNGVTYFYTKYKTKEVIMDCF